MQRETILSIDFDINEFKKLFENENIRTLEDYEFLIINKAEAHDLVWKFSLLDDESFINTLLSWIEEFETKQKKIERLASLRLMLQAYKIIERYTQSRYLNRRYIDIQPKLNIIDSIVFEI